jgi:protocatechuate 3,4-dioxygenase beta subunit
MKRNLAFLLLAVFLVVEPLVARERIVGGPCEGCEAVFEHAGDSLPSRAAIAGPAEAGERLLIEGTVRNESGAPVAGVIVYAYHTDDAGIYPRDSNASAGATARHGRLRGFARTDANGNYAFDTIRPAGYPNTELPQHVHFHVLEPGRCTYWIDDLVFSDDPRLTASQRRDILRGRGGEGLATPTRDSSGVWHARRDIMLGAGIGDYASCGEG